MAQAKHGSDIENTQDDLLNKAQVKSLPTNTYKNEETNS